MKAKMNKIHEMNEKIIIPIYFIGNETDEYVTLDYENMFKEFEKQIKLLTGDKQ